MKKQTLWKVIVIVLILAVIISLITISFSKESKISNFEECAKAGNPVGESYPRQCWTPGGKHFFEDISDDVNDYFIDELRIRGINNIGGMPIEGFNPELYKMAFSEFVDSDFDNAEAIGGIWIFDGKLKWVANNFGGPITSADGTITNEGLVVVLENLEKRLGIEVSIRADVTRIIDAIDGRDFCPPESRNVEACITLYDPVCGWNDPEKIQCIKFPCANTYSNSCFACADENVLYYTNGVCPE